MLYVTCTILSIVYYELYFIYFLLIHLHSTTTTTTTTATTATTATTTSTTLLYIVFRTQQKIMRHSGIMGLNNTTKYSVYIMYNIITALEALVVLRTGPVSGFRVRGLGVLKSMA